MLRSPVVEGSGLYFAVAPFRNDDLLRYITKRVRDVPEADHESHALHTGPHRTTGICLHVFSQMSE